MSEMGALEGVRVVDAGLLVQGPQAALMLAEFGADVIKVELPGFGDQARWIPLSANDLRTPYYEACNRGKRSVTIDLRVPEGREAFLDLVDTADVVISNFKPGTLDDWGLGYDVVAERNPRVVYATGSTFGPEGPDATLEGADLAGQAAGGLIRTTGTEVPVLLVCTEGGLSVVSHDWGMDDVVLHTCGPAELEARIKLAIGRLTAARDAADPDAHVIRSGEVVVDDATYTAKVGKRTLDLTFKEFELLKFLAQHPGRVFSRQQLLQEVWGYDYFGGTRTVDVHVRRLRAKLGPENETLIGTVRNVGYRFVLPTKESKQAESDARRTEDTRVDA